MGCSRVRVLTSIVLVASLSAGSVARAETAASLRDLLEARRGRGDAVVVELRTGDRVGGAIGRTKKEGFYVLDGVHHGARMVRYADIRAVLDPATGEQVAAVQAIQPKLRQPSLRTLIIAGAAIATLIVWLVVMGTGT